METKVIVDTMWVLLTAMLVFFMNLGFAAVESGFARAKNCANIMSKNFIVFGVSSLGFLILGWGLMFGNGNGLFFGGGLKLLGAQLAAVLSVAVFVFAAAAVTWVVLRVTMGIRVSREEELRGLDIGEHGNEAYAGFQVFTTA